MAPLLPALRRICIVNRSRERLQGLKDQVQEEYPELAVQATLLSDRQAVDDAATSADVLCLYVCSSLHNTLLISVQMHACDFTFVLA